MALDMAGNDDKFGVAFSGGGIRSAAFCSGVLRRLIDQEAEPDYLSCVSGGGYTGSAYVEWKCRNRQNPGQHRGQNPGQNQDNWTDDFFNQMREQTGYYCNWQNCCQGCCDSVILGALVVFVAIIVPIIGWGSFACPIAFMVNLLFEKFLDGTLCRRNADSTDCRERKYLFITSISIFVFLHLLEYLLHCCENKDNYSRMKRAKVPLKIAQMISGATFAFTFLPWFINDFLQYTDLWIRIFIVFVTAVFWFFVPVLRKYSSLVILIYAYSYAVYWRIYKGKLFSIQYTENRFRNCMTFSLVTLGVFSVLGDVPLRLVHIYSRWRLQKAFYYHKNEEIKKRECCFPGCSYKKDCCSCCSYEEQCCYCYDIFPGGHCRNDCCTSCICPPTEIIIDHNYERDLPSRALTLKDLNDIKPQYISNMVVNGWRRKYNQKYCLLTMSPQGISVIDQQPTAPPPSSQPLPSSSQPSRKAKPPLKPKPSSSSQIPPSSQPSRKPPPPPKPPSLSSPLPRKLIPSSSQPPPSSSQLPRKLIPSSSSQQSPSSSQLPSSSSPLPQKLIPSSSQSLPSPSSLRLLDNFRRECLNGQDFKDKLKPSDIKLSSAMAMSAATVSPYFGKYEEIEQTTTHFLTMCGIEMAANLVSDMVNERSESKCKKYCCLYFVNAVIAIVFIAVGLTYCFLKLPDNYFPTAPIVVTGVGLLISIFLLLVLSCITCCSSGSCSGCCSRWCIVHLPIYRFVRSLLHIISDGETPPAIMHLSDGGHFENFGLLPLLKLRLPKILVVDGSHIGSDEEYAKGIATAMEQAREILDCSFTAIDRGDVLTDIKNNFVKPVHGDLQRKYEFKVHYSTKDDVHPHARRATEGHIVLIAPRRPPGQGENGVHPDNTWKLSRDLSTADVDHISGFPAGLGCCDCCHYGCVSSCCRKCSCLASCLSFPRHATANQFFTPEMFTVYHREGFRTCMQCDAFLPRAPVRA